VGKLLFVGGGTMIDVWAGEGGSLRARNGTAKGWVSLRVVSDPNDLVSEKGDKKPPVWWSHLGTRQRSGEDFR